MLLDKLLPSPMSSMNPLSKLFGGSDTQSGGGMLPGLPGLPMPGLPGLPNPFGGSSFEDAAPMNPLAMLFGG
ncbi:MAG TPA: hypothetical protein VK447_04850, partial [Myxococcaceae bacterium]|nr:hypothetical protein [Myxococcaceae bacterium]